MGFSSQDFAIATAIGRGELSLVERAGRFGNFYAIADSAGTIEVCDTAGEAHSRVRDLRERALNAGNADLYNGCDAILTRWVA